MTAAANAASSANSSQRPVGRAASGASVCSAGGGVCADRPHTMARRLEAASWSSRTCPVSCNPVPGNPLNSAAGLLAGSGAFNSGTNSIHTGVRTAWLSSSTPPGLSRSVSSAACPASWPTITSYLTSAGSSAPSKVGGVGPPKWVAARSSASASAPASVTLRPGRVSRLPRAAPGKPSAALTTSTLRGPLCSASTSLSASCSRAWPTRLLGAAVWRCSSGPFIPVSWDSSGLRRRRCRVVPARCSSCSSAPYAGKLAHSSRHSSAARVCSPGPCSARACTVPSRLLCGKGPPLCNASRL